VPLVGDVIVQAREAFPDPPSVIGGAPTNITAVAVVNGSGALPAGTYYIMATLLNPWGESLPCAEITVVVGGGGTNAIQVSFGFTLPYIASGQTSIKVYMASSPGAESSAFLSYGLGAVIITGFIGAISQSNGTVLGMIAGPPPLRSTMWNPDSDGGFVGAATMYRWLNDGLQKMSRIAGGIPGMTAVQAIAGQSMYRIPGRWIRLTNAWFDGWPLTFGKRGDVFLHNNVMGVTGIVTIEEWTNQTVVQAWPQPNRTGAATATSGAIGNADGLIAVVSSTSFLSLGLAMLVGTPFNFQGVAAGATALQTELFAYTGLNTSPQQLLNCVRGIGGTTALGFGSGTQILEANLRFAGFRQPPFFSIGQAYSDLGIPLGWEVPLSNYLVAQYRLAEQQTQESMAIEKGFTDDVTALAKLYRGKTGPIQIGSITREVYPGGYSGGILIP
jgi:hypothetical protein